MVLRLAAGWRYREDAIKFAELTFPTRRSATAPLFIVHRLDGERHFDFAAVELQQFDEMTLK